MAVDPDSWIISRTCRIQHTQGAGTAFYATVGTGKFLITAKHIVSQLQDSENIQIKFLNGWHPYQVARVAFCAHGSDVAAIKLVQNLGDALSEKELNAEILLGQEVIYCGFPLGMENEPLPDFPNWLNPIVKGAIMSGGTKENGYREYLFDTHNNKGFSGGPIIKRDRKTNALSVVAVVTNYKFDRPLAVQKRQEDGEFADLPDYQVLPNSGFMRAVPINLAIEAAKTLL